MEPVRGAALRLIWKMRGIRGHYIFEEGASGHLRREAHSTNYIAALPHVHLITMVQWTSEVLQDKRKRIESTGELLKFLGIHISGTRYQFGKLRDL